MRTAATTRSSKAIRSVVVGMRMPRVARAASAVRFHTVHVARRWTDPGQHPGRVPADRRVADIPGGG